MRPGQHPGERMYSSEAIVDGFPGKSKSHGAFGWSSLWLLQGLDRCVLIDTGPPAYMPLIHRVLRAHGLTTANITDVVLTHLHWDHVGNVTMFPDATLWVGEEELAWAAQQAPGTQFISDLHVQYLLQAGDRVQRIKAESQVLPGIVGLGTPGHTPGHLAFLVESREGALIFAGDAVKNAYELATSRVDSTMNDELSRASVARLRGLLSETSGRLIPGHDVPLLAAGDGIERAAAQVAEISVFADACRGEQHQSISLEGPQPATKGADRQ
jgi:N-acyl homoserine lactone hydrolase